VPERLPPLSRRILTGSGVTVAVGTLLGLGTLWALAYVAGLGPSPVSTLLPALLNGAAVLAVLVLGLVWWLRPGRLAADLTVVVVAVYVSGTVLLALSGTPWGLHGLFGDQAFRTEAVTRFTQRLANVDHAYQGLPGHYPPLLPWLEGRAAVLLDRPGWQVVKPGQVVLSALVPVLSYWFWRRIVTPVTAAAVVATTTLFLADPYKIDQWLVLALVVPWWLDAFRGLSRAAVRAWPTWLHGVVAGLLVTTYTFYFLPLAVATVMGILVDAVRRRPWVPQVGRVVVISVVGLVVSAWYWLPLALERLRGTPADDQQLRWFAPQHADVVSPFEVSALGALMVLGVVFMVAALPRSGTAAGLALVAVAGYVVLGVGLVITALGLPFLAFKTEVLVMYPLVAAGVLALLWSGRVVARRFAAAGYVTGAVPRIVVAALMVLCLAGALRFVDTWAQGRPVDLAHGTALPDGSQGRYADQVHRDELGQAGGFYHEPEASVMEIMRALGIAPTDDPVIVTHRVDLLATTTIHPFTTWRSIYSNPFARFTERVQFLDTLSRTRDPEEFVRMTQQNPFDRIDGFVLARREGRWVAHVSVDDFPDGVRPRTFEFTAAQFDHPRWRVTQIGDFVVVTSLRD
jgi:galactan 5-O-arabinofuranosyltransferase